jgi:pimeloyl-ACP methyl ester carboxylesterase
MLLAELVEPGRVTVGMELHGKNQPNGPPTTPETRYGGPRVRRPGTFLRSGLLALGLAAALLGVTASAGAATHRDLSASQVRTLLLRHAFPVTSASDAPTPCGKPTGVLCTTVTVPLDRSGAFPGTVPLHVEVLPAQGTPRGAIFLIAGGPGQGSAHVYGLGDPDSVSLYRYLFPGYTLVAYDDRGTGDSGLIDCPELQKAITADTERAAAATCANEIGPARDFYTTADHAEDLDAVRAALGFDKIALFGVSYGTKLALAYALAHPDHVERMLLDSVLPPDQPDPYSANVLRELPSKLREFCSDGGCKGATSNFPADVIALANKFGTKALHGKATEPNGRKNPVQLDGVDLLSLILSADLNPGLAAELPAVVKAARNGNVQPLVRLTDLNNASSFEPSIELSSGLYAATVCHDGPFPWSPDTPPASRAALEQAAIAGLPAGTLGPFGAWSARFGNADFCLGWPSPSGGGTLGAGPYPNVPVLAVSGGFDMRTPTSGAQSIISQFPQGKLLVVPGVGHSTVTADFSACAARAVHSWMTGAAVPATCKRSKPLVVDVSALPSPGQARPAHRATPAKTLTIVSKTVQEAEAAWLMTVGLSGTTDRIPGIFGGYLVGTSGSSFRLVRYAIARGVTVSGTLAITKIGPPIGFRGTLTVGGAAAADGVLGMQGTKLSGTLGGTFVR